MINPECPVHKEGGPVCICASEREQAAADAIFSRNYGDRCRELTAAQAELERVSTISEYNAKKLVEEITEQQRLRAELARVRGLLQRYGVHGSDCSWFNWELSPPRCSCGFNEAKAAPSGAESAGIGKLETADESGVESTKGEQNGLSVSAAGNAQPSDADSVLKLDDGVAPSLSSPLPINPYKYAFEFVRDYLGLPKESPDDGEDLKKLLPIMRDAILAAFPKPTHKNGDVK